MFSGIMWLSVGNLNSVLTIAHTNSLYSKIDKFFIGKEEYM